MSAGGCFAGLKLTVTSNLQIFACGHNREILSSVTRTLHFDVTNRHEVDEVIAGVRPNVIIHLAAVSTVHEAREAPRQAWDVNLYGTMNVGGSRSEALPASAVHLRQHVRSLWRRAEMPGGPIDETAPLDPLNPYAASKAAADLMIGQMAREGLNAIRVRPFNHTGPGQTESFVIPAFAAQIARIEAGIQEPVIRVGNLDTLPGLPGRTRCRRGLSALGAFTCSFEPGLVLNLASGIARRIGDILDQLIFTGAGFKIRIETDPSRLRASDTPFANGNASRIRKLLGWESRKSHGRQRSPMSWNFGARGARAQISASSVPRTAIGSATEIANFRAPV